uniref:Pepsin inhibitor-3-like repeated domain-containing protein n=1 Tax=Panagrolaimus superbus TaxID=310955 RepID=A0A914XWL3_9BILA
MKYFTLCVLAVVAFASANPAKRFAGFGNILSSVGGNLGCVVTGNKLYINGLFEKNLTSGEQEEFSDYEQRLQEFKKEIRQVIAQRRQELLEQRQQNGSGQQQQTGMLSMEESNDEPQQQQQSSSSSVSSSVTSASNSSLPKPPQKPSFCSGDTTTQYIFDGCKVQNGKVYVGTQYARDLTSDEQQRLQDFDKKMTAYQAQLSSSLQQQVKELFGDQLAQLFGSGRVNSTSVASTPAPQSDEATTAAAILEAPEAPNFCTIVY